ncbi:spore coat U domain-containing protein [Sinorhizobium medicae]|uniref:Csu type fimbrial protein n=1 Tax=Sinorhizobium medicae TaxID=110321 RepID=UPI001F28D9ED|nr:spore coat U domain-containing protein [Sinorhizobium medicae]
MHDGSGINRSTELRCCCDRRRQLPGCHTEHRFWPAGVLSSNIDATGRATVTCTPATAYTVGLSNGMSGTSPTNRRMTLGGAAVVYGLYKDAGRSQPWGDGATPGSTVAGTGTGAAKGYTVYGRVPPQTTPTPGTYSDTVVVTVTY